MVSVDRIGSFNRKYSFPGLLLMVVLILVPVAFCALEGYGGFTSFLKDKALLKDCGFTILYASACTITSFILAIPGVAVYSGCRPGVRKLLRAILAFAFFFPPVLMVLCFNNLFGRHGLLTVLRLSGLWKASILYCAYNIPLFIIMAGGHLRSLDLGKEETARSLGASPLKVFFSITLPRLRPALAGTGALVFIRILLDSIIAHSFNDSSYLFNIQEKAYSLFLTGNRSYACTLSLVVMLIAIPALIVLSAQEKKRDDTVLCGPYVRRRRGNAFTRLLSFIYMTVICAVMVLPVLGMVWTSLKGESGMTLASYRALFSLLNPNWLVALGFVLAVTIVAPLLCSLVSRSICVGLSSNATRALPALLSLAMCPLVTALGYSGILNFLPDTVPVRMTLILCARILVLIPLQVMVILPVARRIPVTLRETSATLGVRSGTGFRRTDARIMRPAVQAAVFSSAALSVSMFGLDEIYGLNTVYSQILRLMGYGDMVTSCTMGTTLMIICYILFLLGIGHIREGGTDV